MKILNIGKEEDSDSHSDHSGHDHRRRRSAASVLLPQQGSGAPHGVHRRAVDDHDHPKTNGDSNDSVSYTRDVFNDKNALLSFFMF